MIWLVPAPAVIVPLVMPHTYVAPRPAFGTEAVLPVEFAHTGVGAGVIVQSGSGFTVSEASSLVADPDALVATQL